MTSRIVTLAGYAGVLAIAATWSWYAPRVGRASLPVAVRRSLATRIGKIVLVLFWAWAGWHLFARGSGAFE